MSSLPTSKCLVVAAWEPELSRLRVLLEDEPRPQLVVDAVGIGAVDAAAGAVRAIGRHEPDLLVLLGTCGAAPGSGLGLLDVVVGTEAILVDPATVEGRAALPYGASVALDAGLRERLVEAGARPARIYCTLGITTDDGLAATLARAGSVEHLEAYSVARACELAEPHRQGASAPEIRRVRCAVVLAVANTVGSTGREQWRANHVAASARAAEVAHRALTSLLGR